MVTYAMPYSIFLEEIKKEFKKEIQKNRRIEEIQRKYRGNTEEI